MENETELIRDQMADTRTALSEKLEALEEAVLGTVEGTTRSVTETVEAVQEAVQDTVGTVKDSVQETMQSVKSAFDVRGYVDEHPWLVLGGGVALGYALGSLFPARHSRASYSGGSPAPASPSYSQGAASYTSSQESSTGGGVSSFLQGLEPVIDQLKGLALGTAASVIGEMIVKNLPDNLKSEVTSMIDDTTRRMGGTVLHERW